MKRIMEAITSLLWFWRDPPPPQVDRTTVKREQRAERAIKHADHAAREWARLSDSWKVSE